MEALPQPSALATAHNNPNAAVIAVFDDFPIADLHEVLVRDGLYLPEICHW